MNKRTLSAASICVLGFAGLGLTGCGGLGLLPSSAPEPTSSYPTISSDAVSTESCNAVVDEINELSRTLTQLSEAVDSGDLMLALSLLGEVQSSLSDFGADVGDDAELEALVGEVRGAAETLSQRLGEFDTENPLAITDGLQGDVDRLESALSALTSYCTA